MRDALRIRDFRLLWLARSVSRLGTWLLVVAADVPRAVAVALLLLVRDPQDLWLVYAALFAENVGAVVFRPAARAHTPASVGTGRASARAWSSLQVLRHLAAGLPGRR
ncbi:hypothetical protein [Actinoplanes sp. NBRC 103695]|uniref:hypothetical protein n=1 Tax=Actinoplanes sp. NBRC 103695 TaxID=3032202 RepID=UPI0024A52923|nr:hypothetical protein [Actinoplanes sp. NBRC 103695]GLZ01916.1 hypothetical protein Acsp02_91670 [Actinoplanes sp. NBRC 103695]